MGVEELIGDEAAIYEKIATRLTSGSILARLITLFCVARTMRNLTLLIFIWKVRSTSWLVPILLLLLTASMLDGHAPYKAFC